MGSRKKTFAHASVRNTVGIVTPDEKALEEARRVGFDLSLLDSNLALSPEERALRHDSALELVQALREAGAAHAQSALASATVR